MDLPANRSNVIHILAFNSADNFNMTTKENDIKYIGGIV